MGRVLVACEFSGVVRDAFLARGHDAWSVDLLPTEADPARHIVADVNAVLNYPDRVLGGMPRWMRAGEWDLMIAHPPCTYLAVSGARWMAGRPEKVADALDFVRMLLDAPIPRIALENPVSIISTRIRKPDQIIQPWQFGHPESKTTCLWLKDLPKLVPTNVLPLPESGRWSNQTASGQNRLSPSPDRWKLRSATYVGIAEAAADQWGAAL